MEIKNGFFLDAHHKFEAYFALPYCIEFDA